MKILALKGSPRENGNSTIMLNRFLEGCEKSGGEIKSIKPRDLDIKPCAGCLRCNLIRRCSLKGDDWEQLSNDILDADIIAISSPVYFFNFPSELKGIIDRFRSFIHVRITEDGLIHTPWVEWRKKFVVLLSMGSPDENEGAGIIKVMKFIVKELGENNELYTFNGTRLAVRGQIEFDRDKLESLYKKLQIPVKLAEHDHIRNRELLSQIYSLGTELGAGGT